MHPRVEPVYVSPSLNYEITENRGDNLAQDAHQSRPNLHRDKCPSASRAEQSVQRRVKRSSPPPSTSINTQVLIIPHQPAYPTHRYPEVVTARRLRGFGYIKYLV
ncbi:AMSH-like ubiquitin thioesterase 3 [Dorcoceras hygrometricum]|uniref:AMSH-like ubiquitin thioesterase 3 n=1 Tax=Dorcoceras hygrometricum TaxID=472368 RepID=A0A2Z7A228_9LAMI|nr:AMSH-like ubiquitin thioesterase 3 [Dorcoceras hygrometricum]